MLNSRIVPPVFCGFLFASAAVADSQYLSLTPTYIPSFIGFGVGSYPDYVGSDDNVIGAAPIARYSFGEQRYVALEVNYATLNLLEDRNWRLGPAGMWRFGRSDVKDNVVDKLPEIDGSLELGGFASFENVGEDPRDRWSFGASFTHGVTGDNDGYTVAASFRRWMPVGQYSALGLSLATTYGSAEYMDTYFSIGRQGATDSGLAAFDADAGMRDVRAMVVFIQPLSRDWQIGGGFLYSRLLNDAADSPIVSKRGTRDQFAFGFGVTRAF